MTMQDVMIDLETLGTRPGSAILTIGAVLFDAGGEELTGKEPGTLPETSKFYRRIDVGSCAAICLTADADTEAWWRRQSRAARIEAFEAEPRVDIGAALNDFGHWFQTQGGRFPWSHGAGFDLVLLEWAYRAIDVAPPWKFWDARDTRTLFAFTGVKVARGPSHHHALHDAFDQALAVQQSYRTRNPDAGSDS